MIDAYAVAFTAQCKHPKRVHSFIPGTLEFYFARPELMRTVRTLILPPVQFLIAETDRRAEEKSDHLLDKIFPPEEDSYESRDFSLIKVTDDIERHLDRLGSPQYRDVGFFLMGGSIFYAWPGGAPISNIFIAGGAYGGTRKEAALRFMTKACDDIGLARAAILGFVFRCKLMKTQDLLAQYAYQAYAPFP